MPVQDCYHPLIPFASSHFELVTLELNCLNKDGKSCFVISELRALNM